MVAFFASTILSVVLLRFVPVLITPLMVIRCVQQVKDGQKLKLSHHWVPLNEISPHLPVAVMASEDARFMEHHGFDFKAIEHAAKRNKQQPQKRKLGASTISQQTAKNVFLWSGRSWVRKGFEAYFTVLIELFWPKQRINKAYQRGIITKEVETDKEFEAFNRLLRHHNLLKPKRYIPSKEFFRGIVDEGHGRLAITLYKGHVIGCSACAYSEGNAFLWYAAYRRKSFAFVHPDILTIWYAIKDAHRRGYDHIFFLDVGLPFRRNPFREFILSFGGKPVSTFRWFRCSIKWVNALLSWIYRD